MSRLEFSLHPQLAADTVEVCELALSRVLLMDNAHWPWLILVPRRNGLRELSDLTRAERIILSDDVDAASRVLQARFSPDKLNVAALGNVVEQLHVHVIARHRTDPAWPAPVWGHQPPVHYASFARQHLRDALAVAFATLP